MGNISVYMAKERRIPLSLTLFPEQPKSKPHKRAGFHIKKMLSRSPLVAKVARWQSGHAEDCKSLYAGSIPARASIILISFIRHCSYVAIAKASSNLLH